MVLRLWKSPFFPDVKKWMESMLEIVLYEHMLARVNDEGENFKRSWHLSISLSVRQLKKVRLCCASRTLHT